MTKKTKKANKKKKPVVSKLEQPVIILTDIYLVKEENRLLAKLKSCFKKVCHFFKCK